MSIVSRFRRRRRSGVKLGTAVLTREQLERLVFRCRNDGVRPDCNANDLRRRHIITKVQWTPQRTQSECPSSVATHSPVATSHTLSVSSRDADTTRRPPGNTATPMTYDEDTSSQKYSGCRATHPMRVPFQRRHAFPCLQGLPGLNLEAHPVPWP